MPAQSIENQGEGVERVVVVRRRLAARAETGFSATMDDIPFNNYDYSKVHGPYRQSLIGYVPIPIATVGPLYLDGKRYTVPMATVEGDLITIINRGCRALSVNGVNSSIVNDKISSSPVARFSSASKACDVAMWLETPENYEIIKNVFDSSSQSFAQLEKITCRHAGRYLFFRLEAITGDVIGMDMISKGTDVAMKKLQERFSEMEILASNGSVCTASKPSAINWIHGRGKSVVAEAFIPAEIVRTVLKTSTAALVEFNTAKNLIGSAMAGSVGGFHAHAASVVAAIFLVTGQDPAQIVTSSNCMTLMAPSGADGKDLHISCTMPCMEVGTIGGGTALTAQRACLKILGVEGESSMEAGRNAGDLARIICATVLAGELSLTAAALTTGDSVPTTQKGFN